MIFCSFDILFVSRDISFAFKGFWEFERFWYFFTWQFVFLSYLLNFMSGRFDAHKKKFNFKDSWGYHFFCAHA